MSDDNVSIKFGADTSGLNAGTSSAASAVENAINKMTSAFSGMSSHIKNHTSEISASSKEMSESVKGSFEGLESAFSRLTGPLIAIGALLAGGEMFKESIQSLIEEADAVKRLSNVFGVTVEEANKLNIGLQMVGISSEAYTGMAMKLDRQLKNNEAGLNKLGVTTRDSNQHLLSQQQIIQNSVKTMMDYKAGTDRNEVAMTMFGRSAAEAYKLTKLNNEVTARAAELADKYGVGLDQKTTEAVKRYKLEHAAAGIVMEDFGQKMAEAVLPALTSMNMKFVEIGAKALPYVTSAFEGFSEFVSNGINAQKIAVGEFIDVIKDLGNIITSVFGNSAPSALNVFLFPLRFLVTQIIGIVELLKMLGETLAWVGNMGSAAFGNMARMLSNLASGNFKGVVNAYDQMGNDFERVSKEHSAKIIEIAKETKQKLTELWTNIEKQPEKTSTTADTIKEGTKSAPPKATKDKSKMGEWEAELADLKVKYQTEHDLLEMSKEDEKKYWEDIKATAKLSAEDKIAISRKVSDIELQILKKQAADEKAIKKEVIDEAEKAANDSIAMAEELNKRDLDLNKISKEQSLENEKKFENARYEIARTAQAARIELASKDPNNSVERQKELNKQLDLERQHAMKILKIDTDLAKEQNSLWDKLSKDIDSLWDKGINAMMNGTLTWRNAMQAIFTQLTQTFITEVIGKQVKAWLFGEMSKTEATQVGAVQRTAIGAWESAQSIMMSGMAAIKNIMNSAWEAMAAAYKAIAGIPFVGPFLAPVVAGGAFAAVAGVAGHIMSAEGGYDIPSGSNPMTQLHEKEMVLPAKYADTIRNMSEGNNSGGVKDVHFNVQAIDQASVKKFFSQNKAYIVQSIKEASRNGSQLNQRGV